MQLGAGPVSRTALVNGADKKCYFPKVRGTQCRPQITIILIMGTPRKESLFWELPRYARAEAIAAPAREAVEAHLP